MLKRFAALLCGAYALPIIVSTGVFNGFKKIMYCYISYLEENDSYVAKHSGGKTFVVGIENDHS